jgi:NAD-dependent SIR2 family protein deacetylase
MKEKTVFILGAGFSYDAGIPTQGNLLWKVLGDPSTHKLAEFIEKVYGLSLAEAHNLALEDLYTPLHTAISRNESLKGIKPEELRKQERSLTMAIGEVLNVTIEDALAPGAYVHRFTESLCNRAKQKDDVAVISLNWDILMDLALNKYLINGTEKVMLDYCCHATGLHGDYGDDRIIPGIIAKERNRPIVKLLKPHGSLNWLYCPQCQRLYINRFTKIAMKEGMDAYTCRICRINKIGSAHLKASLLLPTFLKDMEAFHIKHVWNQMAIELAEADRLVFMGYSFPMADYHFRTAITRFTKTDCKIDAVLWKTDQSNGVGERYNHFFGSNRTNIFYEGVNEYLINKLPNFYDIP